MKHRIAGIIVGGLVASTAAFAQQHQGHGNRGSGGWQSPSGPGSPHQGFHPNQSFDQRPFDRRPFGQRPFDRRPFAHRSFGYYPRYGYSYPYYVPPVIGYYGPSYYEYPSYAVTPYYEYVEPPPLYYELPPVAQIAPPPPAPRPTTPAAPPEPVKPAPQPTPAPKTFERFTLSANELFAFDRAELTLPQPKLDQIAAVLNGNPQIGSVRIIGYTDRLGSNSYNLRLSQRRANAVKSYFVSKGIAANRLVAIGRGEADPIVFCEQKNRTELIECLRANRRVVVEPITVERPR